MVAAWQPLIGELSTADYLWELADAMKAIEIPSGRSDGARPVVHSARAAPLYSGCRTDARPK